MALKITQKKGLVGANPKQRKNMQSLGLRRINHSVVRQDTPIVRGMIKLFPHMQTSEHQTT